MHSDRGTNIEQIAATIKSNPDITPRSKLVLSAYVNHFAPLIMQNKLSVDDLKKLDIANDLERETALIFLLRGNEPKLPARPNALGKLLECGFTFGELFNCKDPYALMALMDEPLKCKQFIESFSPALQPVIRKKLMQMVDDAVVSTIEEKTCRYLPITLADIHNLPELAKKYLLDQNQYEFLALIKNSEKIARFVLARPDLCEKLDKVKLNHRGQTFLKSCTAYAVMMILRQLDLIPKDEFTRHKELEIYINVWEAPGKIANIQAILNYLKSQNIPGEVIEDPSISENLIRSQPTLQDKYEKEIKPQKISTFKADILNDGDHLIFFVANSRMNLHTLIIRRHQEKYILTDPDTLKSIENSSLSDLLQNVRALEPSYIYTGISIKISAQVRPEQTLSRSASQILFSPSTQDAAGQDAPSKNTKPGSNTW